MKTLFIVLSLSLVSVSAWSYTPKAPESLPKAAVPESKKELAVAVAGFKGACEKLLKKDKKVKNAGLRCGCVGDNLAAKLKIAEVQLLTKVYQGDEKAENELELEANTPLQDFELEVSQNCLANPKWKITL
jgi:hypothetical protein